MGLAEEASVQLTKREWVKRAEERGKSRNLVELREKISLWAKEKVAQSKPAASIVVCAALILVTLYK